jgi:hypothetical protein
MSIFVAKILIIKDVVNVYGYVGSVKQLKGTVSRDRGQDEPMEQ